MGATYRWRKERRTFYVYVTDHGRRWAKRVGRSEEEAQAVAHAIGIELEARDLRSSQLYPGAALPFERVARAWWDTVRASRPNSTRVTNRAIIETRLIPYFRGLELRQLDADAVRAFAAHEIERGHARETVHGSLSVLRRIIHWSVEKRLLDEAPVPGIMRLGRQVTAARGAPRRTPPAWSYEEVRILLEVCRERGKWLWAPVFFANQTGARRGGDARAACLGALSWQALSDDPEARPRLSRPLSPTLE